ncbi:MAG: peptidylprolyl isomerase FKBP-type [Caulobacteraceae bacterium]|nr:peptidylprolyl isomerase FKBP-type [Caulobacteraceae bacterium]
MKRLLIPALLVALALSACHKAPKAPSATDAGKLKVAATAIMTENAKKPGVKVIEDGVQYQVISSGPATGANPGPRDQVKVMYEGTLPDGSVFDSSYARGQPAIFALNEVVPGWSTALQKMRPGDVWYIWLSPDKGYGYEDNGPLPAGSVLKFKVELQGFLPATGQG